MFFETFPYQLNEKTGTIDYDKMEENAKLFRPKVISALPSQWYPTLIKFNVDPPLLEFDV